MPIMALGEERARGRPQGSTPADQAGDVDGIEPAADRDAVARPVLDRLSCPPRGRRRGWCSPGSVPSSEVLPTPGGPKMATVVLLFASARRSSAVTMRRVIASPCARRAPDSAEERKAGPRRRTWSETVAAFPEERVLYDREGPARRYFWSLPTGQESEVSGVGPV